MAHIFLILTLLVARRNHWGPSCGFWSPLIARINATKYVTSQFKMCTSNLKWFIDFSAKKATATGLPVRWLMHGFIIRHLPVFSRDKCTRKHKSHIHLRCNPFNKTILLFWNTVPEIWRNFSVYERGSLKIGHSSFSVSFFLGYAEANEFACSALGFWILAVFPFAVVLWLNSCTYSTNRIWCYGIASFLPFTEVLLTSIR